MNDWTCSHGVGPGMTRGDCEPCNVELASRPSAASLSGDARASEVRELLNEPSTYRVGDIHGRLEGLVGRPVWTHEFAQDLALAEEARSWEHPADLIAHAVSSWEALADGKPVIVIRADGSR